MPIYTRPTMWIVVQMTREVILLVEDNPDDVVLVGWVFEHSQPGYRLIVLPDGRDAVNYLSQARDHGYFQALPRMIILDLKMRDVDGFHFLRWWRQQRILRDIPVLVLTGSTYAQDIDRAWRLGADFRGLQARPIEWPGARVGFGSGLFWRILSSRPPEGPARSPC